GGTGPVTASAGDRSGDAGVPYFVDGTAVGSQVTAAPYTYSWDTTKLANGTHTLTATATDAAGNATTSSAVSVIVDNTAPAVSLTRPAAGPNVPRTGTVTATPPAP